MNLARSLVMRPGHVALRVMDLEVAVHHYRDIIGLVETGRDALGRVYLKAWDEQDHHSVVLREDDRPGLDYIGFKVIDADAYDILAHRLERAGIATETIPAGEHMQCGDRLRFVTPSGHAFEIYHEKGVVGNGLPDVNPAPWPDGLVGMQPSRFDHALLYGNNFDETVALLIDVFDFDLTEQIMDGDIRVAAFLSCSNKAHDLAVIRHEASGALHHVSFNLDEWSDLLRAGDIMGKHRITIDAGPTRHGLTRGKTIYFYDPSGNRNEVFCGGSIWYPDKPVVTWTMEEIGQAIFYHDREIKPQYLEAYT